MDTNHNRGNAWLPALAITLALVAVLSVYPGPRLLIELSWMSTQKIAEIDRLKLESEMRASLLQGLSSLVLILGGVTAVRQLHLSRQQAAMDRIAMRAETLSNAIGNLESPRPATQVSGVYAIGALIRSAPEDAETLLEILCLFVKDRPPAGAGRPVEVALRILSQHNAPGRAYNLAGANLAGMDLRDLCLDRANLDDVDARDATLTGSTLLGTSLYRADFSRADLRGCPLSPAQVACSKTSGTILN